jgi:para-nitrobenzyl esterase
MRAALSLLSALLLAGAAEPDPTLVRIDAGEITGGYADSGKSIRVYRGIPYAAPPVGALRWKPPRPVEPWTGVRACTGFGNACPQPSGIRYGPGVREPQSEDCLYLNVWTPARGPGAKLPVMFWIHGGGHTIGAGSLETYHGAELAKRGVVVVTINYRLGPFGYFAHPLLSAETKHGISGNYGLLDQVAALRWVKRNIAAFGGDPGCVTIFGESAGSVSVSCLMVTPISKGLFHRAVAQSGGVTGIRETLGSMERKGVEIERELGCHREEDRLAALRAVPAERLLAASHPSVARADGNRFGPIVDGRLLPRHPAELWAEGKTHRVPFMAGSNADDGGVFTRGIKLRNERGYRFALRRIFGEDARRVEEMFPASDDEDVMLTARRLVTVCFFVSSMRSLARGSAATGSKTWLYHFRRVSPLAERLGLGAAHGLEIPYVFGTFGPRGFDETDRALGEKMRSYWVQFARTGDPNADGLPEWPAYDAKTDRHLDFGDEVVAGAKLWAQACDLFDGIRAKRAPAEVSAPEGSRPRKPGGDR